MIIISGIFIIVIAFIGSLALLAIINGFVFSNLWNWFIVTNFNLPELTILQAIGVGIVVAYFHYTPEYENHKIKNPWIVFIRPFIVLLVGYIFKNIFL